MREILYSGIIRALRKNGNKFFDTEGQELTEEQATFDLLNDRAIKVDRTNQKIITTPEQQSQLILKEVGIPLPIIEATLN